MNSLPSDVGSDVVDKAATVLVGYAAEHDPVALRRLGQRVLEVVAPELADELDRAALQRAEDRALRDRFLSLSPTGDGAVRVLGRLDTEGAASCGPLWTRCATRAGRTETTTATPGNGVRMPWWRSASWR